MSCIIFRLIFLFFIRVKFNRIVVKCLDCKATAHLEHKDKVPLPCIPVKNTPSKNGVSLFLNISIILFINYTLILNSKSVVEKYLLFEIKLN